MTLPELPGPPARSAPDSSVARPPLRNQVILFWTLALALPIAILFNLELWVDSNYTRGLFHAKGFTDLYVTGIFRYRLLGRILLLKTYDLLLHVMPHRSVPTLGDPEADQPFVLAYAVLNGLCFSLSNFILLWLCWMRRRGFRLEFFAFYFYTILLISASMAIVTPYDQLAYLLLLLLVIGIRVENTYVGYVLITVSAIAGMLNRETEFLGTALLITLALFTTRPLSNKLWRFAGLHLVLCLGTYLALRLLTPGKAAVSSILTFGGKWGPSAGVVAMLLLVATLMLCQFLHLSLRPALLFLLLSTPYFLLILLTGVLRELRLLCPVILCLFCLYRALASEAASQSIDASY